MTNTLAAVSSTLAKISSPPPPPLLIRASASSRKPWPLPAGPGVTSPAAASLFTVAEYIGTETTLTTNELPEDLRRQLFAELVAMQDRGLSVAESRDRVSKKHHVTWGVVKAVEREGIENQWPPLAESEPLTVTCSANA